jgi:hypothetical protein
MPPRFILLALLFVFPGFCQRLRMDRAFGGSGDDSINSATVDSAGNIYVVGTTFSFEFPLRSAFQDANSGTQLIFSTNAGSSWEPLSVPFPSATPAQPLSIAVDPTNSQIVYIASGNTVCKSVDGAQQFKCTIVFSDAISETSITSLVIDSQRPLTIYMGAATNGGVYKSVDGGQTWTNASQGLSTQPSVDSVVIDPFHTNVLYAGANGTTYVSTNAASSWALSTMPPLGMSGVNVSFDPVKPGILYGPACVNNQFGIQKSSDGGVTWAQLNTPFSSSCVVPDPKVSGLLYTLAPVDTGPAPYNFWKSSDGGVTWKSYPFPFEPIGTLAVVVDPTNPEIMLAGSFRSTDGGQTWNPTNASRVIQPVFAPSSAGLVYAAAPITSDAFLAKFLPDGETLVFSTYFGGMGNDSGQGIALDASGNIWITGSTSSYDLPVTPGAFQNTLKGSSNAFAAKFSNDGKLRSATYLGGSGIDNGLGIAIGPQGAPWLIGSWNSNDFPFSAVPPANFPSSTGGFLAEFDPAATRLLYSVKAGAFDASGKGIAIDSSGNITLTGTVYGDFPITPGAFHAGDTSSGSKAFALKLTSSGEVIYSTFFGGTQAPVIPQGSEDEHDHGVAVAVDDSGSAYITGNTSATDFPTTTGAHQTSLADGCSYPAFTLISGFGAGIYDWFEDDVFVVKLSANGKTAFFSTLLGGSCYDRPTSIALGPSGQIYVAGETNSRDFPGASNERAAPTAGQYASFVSVFNSTASALSFSSYLYSGSSPTVLAGPDKSIFVAGSSGLGAQSQPLSSNVNPFPPTATDGDLSFIDPATERHHPPRR